MTLQRLIAVGLSASLLCACTKDAETDDPPTATDQQESDKIMSNGLIEYVSSHDFMQTTDKLRAGIESRPVKLFAEIDHAQGAASADLELAPSTLFIFGNPKGGTPLMTKEPRMGIVLPLKIHVYEVDGKVMISHEDMASLADRYGLDPEEQPIPNISALLAGLAAEAAE